MVSLVVVAVEAPGLAQVPAKLAGLHARPVTLRPAERVQWEDQLAQELTAQPAGQVVAWALNEQAALALARAARRFDNVLAVATESAAVGAVRALEAGQSVAGVVYPPPSTTDRVLSQAGLGQERFADRPWPLELTPEPMPTWLTVTPEGVKVAALGLTPLERAALAERAAVGGSAPPAAPAPGRLLIGSANYAGQGRAWADAVNRHVPGFRALNIQLRTFTARVFEADQLVRVEDLPDPVARVDLALELVAPASHILLEDLRGLIGVNDLREPDLAQEFGLMEAEQLLASGRRVACMVHGTAGRTPALHRSLEPWSPYHDERSEFFQSRARAAEWLHQALGALGVPVFVSTLDMLDYFEEAHWLPVVVSSDDLAPAPPWEPGAKLKVAHAPSSDVMKGSEFVDAALWRLAHAGMIEYTSVRGLPPVAVPRLLRQVDVVVDQVVLGNPDTLLSQTMAAGRLAVAHIGAATRRRYPEPLPVVEADPSTIAEVVADIAADPSAYRALAEAGPDFVRRFHDGRFSAEVLNRHFLALEGRR
ncbi:MAG: hypothetical protein LBC97_11010 [Bifidobacteriaceae bacterium]|jgi:hypothetical protein|nr:hypothetical protein [Bifidobacteriaceae bacterium]